MSGPIKMVSKKHFLLTVWCLVVGNLVLGQPDVNCSLTVTNKDEFENEIFTYLEENSKTLILEYNLDFSGAGRDFDLNNRTNPDAFQPWRWYRTKGKGIERLLLFYSKYLFESILVVTFKNVKVRILPTPYGCLNNISREDMEPLIRKFLLDDFGINVDELRTSSKLNNDAEICTAHLTTNDNTTADFNYWCCGYDLHNHMSCYSVGFKSHIAVALIVVSLFVSIFFLYSPMLFPKATKPRKMYYKCLNPVNINIMVKEMGKKCCLRCGESKEIEIYQSSQYLKSFFTKLNSLAKNTNYAVRVKQVNLSASNSSFMSEDQRTFDSLSSFTSFFMSGTSITDYRSTLQKCMTMIPKLLLFVSLFTVPLIIYFYFEIFNNSFEEDLNKAYVDRGLLSSSDINSEQYMGIALVVISFIAQLLFIGIIFVDHCRNDTFGTSLEHLSNKMKKKWRSIFDKLNEGYRKCSLIVLIYIIGSPLIIVFIFLSSSPFVLISSSMLSKKMHNKLRVSHFFVILAYLFFIVMLLPSIFVTKLLIIVVAVFMFQATMILPILSGLGALLLNLRLFSKSIGKTHYKCLKNLVYLVNKHKEAGSSTNNTSVESRQQSPPSGASQSQVNFATILQEFLKSYKEIIHELHQSSIHKPTLSIVPRKNYLYLNIKKSPAYLLENEMTKINKCAILYCMRHLYVEAFIAFLVIIAFLSAIVSVVFVLGQFDYIDTSSQVLITFFTGVIPSLVMLGKSEKHECPTEGTTIEQIPSSVSEDLKRIISKLDSYSEEYLIEGLELEDTELDECGQVSTNVDFIVNLSEPPEERTRLLN